MTDARHALSRGFVFFFSVYSYLCFQVFHPATLGKRRRDTPDLVESAGGLPLYWSSINMIHIWAMLAKLLLVTMATGFKRKPRPMMWRPMVEHQIRGKVEVPDGGDSVYCHFSHSLCVFIYMTAEVNHQEAFTDPGIPALKSEKNK